MHWHHQLFSLTQPLLVISTLRSLPALPHPHSTDYVCARKGQATSASPRLVCHHCHCDTFTLLSPSYLPWNLVHKQARATSSDMSLPWQCFPFASEQVFPFLPWPSHGCDSEHRLPWHLCFSVPPQRRDCAKILMGNHCNRSDLIKDYPAYNTQ